MRRQNRQAVGKAICTMRPYCQLCCPYTYSSQPCEKKIILSKQNKQTKKQQHNNRYTKNSKHLGNYENFTANHQQTEFHLQMKCVLGCAKKGGLGVFLCEDDGLAPWNIPRGGGGVLPMWWVIHTCRGFDPLFSLWQDRARSFWGIFSHPPTPKRSFGVLKLPILKEFDLLGPKFHFSLDLFGSNFQRPAAHPHQFSDRVPPPGNIPCSYYVLILDP